jgi:predicted DNA-binding antitoxin AbrB/MazE fold protein
MNQLISAVYENGVLLPDQPLDLPNGTRMRILLEPLESSDDLDRAWEEWDQLCDEVRLDASATRLTREQLHERR